MSGVKNYVTNSETDMNVVLLVRLVTLYKVHRLNAAERGDDSRR
jgi:hypothetical protein